MSIAAIKTLNKKIAAHLQGGASLSAKRLLSDTVAKLVRAPYALPGHVKFLAHYTSIDVLFSLLSCPPEEADLFDLSTDPPAPRPSGESEFLRLYDTSNANDPNEGRFFVHSAPDSHPFTRQYARLWALLEDRARLPAYVAAFRALSEARQVDDLLFWRTYGKDGKGCAVVFPIENLAVDTPVLQVRYGPASVEACLDDLCAVFGSLSAAPAIQGSGLLYGGGKIPPYVSSSLSPLPYLHKANGYGFEQEVRIVVPYEDLNPKSLFGHRTQRTDSGTTLRHFAQLETLSIRNLLRTGSLVCIGAYGSEVQEPPLRCGTPLSPPRTSRTQSSYFSNSLRILSCRRDHAVSVDILRAFFR